MVAPSAGRNSFRYHTDRKLAPYIIWPLWGSNNEIQTRSATIERKYSNAANEHDVSEAAAEWACCLWLLGDPGCWFRGTSMNELNPQQTNNEPSLRIPH